MYLKKETSRNRRQILTILVDNKKKLHKLLWIMTNVYKKDYNNSLISSPIIIKSYIYQLMLLHINVKTERDGLFIQIFFFYLDEFNSLKLRPVS